MTSHVFKSVPKKEKPFSFVEAVTKHGDYWSLALPPNVRASDRPTSDALDRARMYYLETGLFPRVRYEDQ